MCVECPESEGYVASNPKYGPSGKVIDVGTCIPKEGTIKCGVGAEINDTKTGCACLDGYIANCMGDCTAANLMTEEKCFGTTKNEIPNPNCSYTPASTVSNA